MFQSFVRYGVAFMLVALASGTAHATCSGACSTAGQVCYDSGTTAHYVCSSGSWASTVNTGAWGDKPLVGASGGSTVTLCGVDTLKPCGGGYYLGDGNLVITPPITNGSGSNQVGCLASAPSTCNQPVGTRPQSDFAIDNLSAVPFGIDPLNLSYKGSYRYGYEQGNQVLVDSYAGSPMKFCKDLNYGGYTDWYLPNEYESSFMTRHATRMVGFISGTKYVWNSSPWTGAWGDPDVRVVQPSGLGGESAQESLNTGSGFRIPYTDSAIFRCVRRN
jgi:hypothetical protein